MSDDNESYSPNKAIADRAVSSGVGLDPVTVLKIVQFVLPMLIRCFGGDDQPDPAQVRATLLEQNERQPRRLRRRTAAKIMRESDKPLTKEQAMTLAEAVIAESIEQDDDAVTGFVKLHL